MLKKLSLGLICTAATLSAGSGCNDCCWGVYGGAEWLHMRPYATHSTYARTMDIDAPPPTPSEDWARNKLHAVCPSYNSGVRVFLGYRDTCSAWGIRGEYLYLNATARNSVAVSQEGLIPGTSERFVLNTLGLYTDPGGGSSPRLYQFINAEGRSKFRLNAFNIELTGRIPSCKPFSLDVAAGVGYAEVDHCLEGLFSHPVPAPEDVDVIFTKNKSYFSGAGPRVAFDARWEVGCFDWLAVEANIGTSLLVSRVRGYLFEEILDDEPMTDFDLNYREDFANCYRVIPAIDARLGFSGTWSCGCTDVSLNIGYRVNHYIQALDTHRLTGSTIEPTNVGATEERLETSKGWTSSGDVSFGGLYLGGSVGF